MLATMTSAWATFCNLGHMAWPQMLVCKLAWPMRRLRFMPHRPPVLIYAGRPMRHRPSDLQAGSGLNANMLLCARITCSKLECQHIAACTNDGLGFV